MRNSATSTELKTRRAPAPQTGFQAGHFFVLLSMVAATAVVMMARDTHPMALILLSAAVISAGLVGLAIARAVAGFMDHAPEAAPLPPHSRDELEREKQLVLRSIKELEFDKAMGKVSDEDFQAIAGRLRARALVLMKDLERPATVAPRHMEPRDMEPRDMEPRDFSPGEREGNPSPRAACPSCGTANDADARFCKSCGSRMEGL
jgi:hypothetical protein